MSDSLSQSWPTMDQNYEFKYEPVTIYRSSRQRIAQLLKDVIRPQDIQSSSSSGCTAINFISTLLGLIVAVCESRSSVTNKARIYLSSKRPRLVTNGLSLVSFSAWHLLILGVMITPATSTQFIVTKPIQILNLIKGTNASIKFDHLECNPEAVPHYTLRYRSEEPPFCCRFGVFGVHISLTNEGLKEGQKDRFSVEGFPMNNTFSVILNISNVSVEDGGSIELVYMFLQYNKPTVVLKTRVKRTAEINVINPPAVVAECQFVRRAANAHYIVRCQSPAENGRVTISCFQALSKIPPITVSTDNEDIITATFSVQFDDQVQCCSHHISENVTQETCDQSNFRHTKQITTPVSHNSILPITKSPLHIDHDLTTEAFRPTSSADQVELSGWVPLYLQVIIVVCISLFNILK